MKTDQADCAYLDAAPVKPAAPAKPATPAQPAAPVQPAANEESGSSRSAIALEDAENEKLLPEADNSDEKATPDIPKIITESAQQLAVETVPERILKIAEVIKEESGDTEDKVIIVEVKEEKAVESAKETEKTV